MQLLCMQNCGGLSHYVMSSGHAAACAGRGAQVNKTTLALVHHCLRESLRVFFASEGKEKGILEGS